MADSREQLVDMARQRDGTESPRSVPCLWRCAMVNDGIEQSLKEFKYSFSTRLQEFCCDSVITGALLFFRCLRATSRVAGSRWKPLETSGPGPWILELPTNLGHRFAVDFNRLM
ncbi:jg27918 [Pararge aegeria aegeria]|uniref:Jg27918 protein n=1 Tax=Pararge aegeria aegeria TaxID=348720 RepID=A0A8S4R5H9_9NEOP|nr:jg27918 [Pararge aegeria aegeria]